MFSGALYEISLTEIDINRTSDYITSYGDYEISYVFRGEITGSDVACFQLDCYDKDNYFLDSVSIILNPGNGQKFKESGSAFIPSDTTIIRITIR